MYSFLHPIAVMRPLDAKIFLKVSRHLSVMQKELLTHIRVLSTLVFLKVFFLIYYAVLYVGLKGLASHWTLQRREQQAPLRSCQGNISNNFQHFQDVPTFKLIVRRVRSFREAQTLCEVSMSTKSTFPQNSRKPRALM